MAEKPLAVAVAAVVAEGKILLIKRKKGGYKGLWGLPGGKIEKAEHVSQAAVREIKEETGLNAGFTGYLGFVSEHLMENAQIGSHFLLHVCKLTPESMNLIEGAEGAVAWFDLGELEKVQEQIIPSDYALIEKMVKTKEKSYYNCVIEKIGDSHLLRSFE